MRKLHKILLDDPLVINTKRHYDGFRVKYATSISEFWKACDFNPDALMGDQVQIRIKHIPLPFDTDMEIKEKSFEIRASEWAAGSYYEKRISIQRLIYRLLQEGWIRKQYLHNELLDDLRYLTNSDLIRRHFPDKVILKYGRYGNVQIPGRKIITQFTDWSMSSNISASIVWTKPILLNYAIWKLLKKNLDVTRHSLIRTLKNRTSIGKLLCPNVYRMLIQYFNLNNLVVADPNPGFGWKAIACILEGCSYHSVNRFSELANFLNCEFNDLDDIHYDCVLLDNNLEGYDPMKALEEWEDKADIKLVFVPAEMRKQMPRPDEYVRVVAYGKQDFIFLYA